MRLIEGEKIQADDVSKLAQRIAEAVDGIPYFIHLVVDKLVEKDRAASSEAVEEIVSTALTDPQDRWHLSHYIGRHRDNTKNMIKDTPIVTVSLGEERIFRLRPFRAKGKIDFEANDKTVFIMPYETNLRWTHEVPKSKRLMGRRISITLRAFENS